MVLFFVLFWGGGPYHPTAVQASWLAEHVGDNVIVNYTRDHLSAFNREALLGIVLFWGGGGVDFLR